MKTRIEHSFTLVEMVVAMAVMLMVAMVIGSAGKIFYDGYSQAVRVSERLKEYMAIDRLWDGAVRNAVPFKWTDEDNQSRFVFEGTEDELLFTALRRADGNTPSALIFIRIKLEEEQLVAYYSFYPRPPWDDELNDDESNFTREVLADKVASVTFQYAEEGEEEIEWEETWEEDEHNAIPLAIRMTVEWTDGRRESWLRRTAGTSLNSNFGYREPPPDTDTSGGTGR